MSSIDDLVVHSARLVQILGLQRFGLVGASLGGWLAAQLALSSPERIGRLVLVSPAGLLAPARSQPDVAATPPPRMPDDLASDPKFVACFWPAQPDASLAALLAREAAATERIMRGLADADRDLRRRLPRLAVPTLVLWGERDLILTADLASEWTRLLPDARAEIVSGGGHLLLDEFPAARAAAARFLSGGE
jgi:pimeloyl-ACP methyl ester carboxylesterase